MPPPTPRTAGIPGMKVPLPPLELLFGLLLGRLHAGVVPTHQTAPHLFHCRHGRLFRRAGQERAGAALQLPRAFRRHNDEPVSAQLRIVRNCKDGTARRPFGHAALLQASFTRNVSRIRSTRSVTAGLARRRASTIGSVVPRRSASTIACSRSLAASTSSLTRT